MIPALTHGVSMLEYALILIIWILYCCTGTWSREQPLKILTFLQGCTKLIIQWAAYGVQDWGASMFLVYIMGRCTINSDREGMCK